jgi:dihydrofolate reductase
VQISVFCGVSIDGFLAHEDHSLAFLDPYQEDHGYHEFFASIDALVIGRLTYDVVTAFPEWPYQDKRVVVLTHRPIETRSNLETHAGLLAPLAARLAAEGVRRAYLDGGIAIRAGLAEDLVDDMTITTVPRTIGSGRALFGNNPPVTREWRRDSVRSYASGLVQVCWQRAR